MNYYNEWDSGAASWLRELIKDGLIPPGEVDERSISNVQGRDLKGFTQCHFFAGIGGWPLALRLAGWPEDRPVWTGSCPCQPFSVAGKRKGEADERHLWPEFFRLIAECEPATVFGEQVASKAGREWLAGVRADLEGVGYAIGAADLCAAGVAAPHLRQRLYWVADADGGNATKERQQCGRKQRQQPRNGFAACGLVHTEHGRPPIEESGPESGIASGIIGRLGFAGSERSQGRIETGSTSRAVIRNAMPWTDSTSIVCRDARRRRIPTEPEIFPLAHGLPNRVVALRGAGNAIVPQVAAEFIAASVEAMSSQWPKPESECAA